MSVKPDPAFARAELLRLAAESAWSRMVRLEPKLTIEDVERHLGALVPIDREGGEGIVADMIADRRGE